MIKQARLLINLLTWLLLVQGEFNVHSWTFSFVDMKVSIFRVFNPQDGSSPEDSDLLEFKWDSCEQRTVCFIICS